MTDAKYARKMRTRGELLAQVMSQDEDTRLLLDGMRGVMDSQRDLPSRRTFFWSGLVFGIILASVAWLIIVHL